MKKLLFLAFLCPFAFGLSEEELAHNQFAGLTNKLGTWELLNATTIKNALDDLNLQAMLEELDEQKILNIMKNLCEKELTDSKQIKKYKEGLSKTARKSLLVATASAVAAGILHIVVTRVWNAWDILDKDLRKQGIRCTSSDYGTRASSWGTVIPKADVDKYEIYNQIFRKLLPLEIIAGVVSVISGLVSIGLFVEAKDPKRQIELIHKQVDIRLKELGLV